LLAQALAAANTGARVAVTVVAAVAGLAVGSFLNVVVWRVPRGLSVVRPGSFCPSCGTPIQPWDNLPVVSWLALGGRCRHCGEQISVRYPVIEFLTGALFAAVAWILGAHWAVPGMCLLGATSLTLAATELDGMPPPATVSLLGTGLGALSLAGAAVADRRWWHLGGMLMGIALACALISAFRARRGRVDGVTTPWALIPAGAAMGWVGPVGAAVGVATAAVVFVGLSALRAARPQREPSHQRTAVAVAAAAGSAAAVVSAFLAGSSIGR
jgi:leader peptidase (prepilin peptidase)/N-methyltransferase